MPSGGLGDDEDTAAGASFGTVRHPSPLAKSADLQTALAPPDADAFGTKIYENVGLNDFTPAPVTRVGDLLGLRSYFMSQLGPRYLWIIKISMIENSVPNAGLNPLRPDGGCPLQAGTGHGRPGQAPGRCGCAVTSLLQRGCGGAVC
jgi:hypothetical protein